MDLVMHLAEYVRGGGLFYTSRNAFGDARPASSAPREPTPRRKKSGVVARRS